MTVVGSPIISIIEGQRKSGRTFLIIVAVVMWIIAGVVIITFLNSSSPLRLMIIGLMLFMGVAPILLYVLITRSQDSYYRGMEQFIRKAERLSIPRVCPNCGGQIDLDRLVTESTIDVNCPYCGARLR